MNIYTKTRSATSEPENVNIDDHSLTPPTRDEIVKQLEEHFAKHTMDVVSPEDISKIADEVNRAFEFLRDKPYGGFAKYKPQKPYLSIRMYHDDWSLHHREKYPSDYSPLQISSIQCSTVRFSMTIVSYLKWISLAYVSKECLF